MGMNSVLFFEKLSTAIFFLAILHTFLIKKFQHMASYFPNGSIGENFFHLIGEIEVVFGFWASIYLITRSFVYGTEDVVRYLNDSNFSEPTFVFVIMTVCSTKPILDFASQLIENLSKLIPLNPSITFYFVILTIGPLLGSIITEPAAMTVTASILLSKIYSKNISKKLMYATIGLLFVNISIGGVLTPFAAPPVLMVATKWGWDLKFMFYNFGYKALVAILISNILVILTFRKELMNISMSELKTNKYLTPFWVQLTHILFLAGIVLAAHHIKIFIGIFLIFLGFVTVTKEYQVQLKLREGLLVGLFLGGLVILGAPQKWWLELLLNQLSTISLYIGACLLTAITDNAALTFLGSQVPNLSELSKYALVAGSVVGGGLTVIANAPNPAGFGILNNSFGEEGMSPLGLFLSALPPTIIAGLSFWFIA